MLETKRVQFFWLYVYSTTARRCGYRDLVIVITRSTTKSYCLRRQRFVPFTWLGFSVVCVFMSAAELFHAVLKRTRWSKSTCTRVWNVWASDSRSTAHRQSIQATNAYQCEHEWHGTVDQVQDFTSDRPPTLAEESTQRSSHWQHRSHVEGRQIYLKARSESDTARRRQRTATDGINNVDQWNRWLITFIFIRTNW